MTWTYPDSLGASLVSASDGVELPAGCVSTWPDCKGGNILDVGGAGGGVWVTAGATASAFSAAVDAGMGADVAMGAELVAGEGVEGAEGRDAVGAAMVEGCLEGEGG